jgi:hypothetical protein
LNFKIQAWKKEIPNRKLSLALTEFFDKVFVRFSVTLFCFPSFYEVLCLKFLAVWIPIFFSLTDAIDFSIKDFKRSLFPWTSLVSVFFERSVVP